MRGLRESCVSIQFFLANPEPYGIVPTYAMDRPVGGFRVDVPATAPTIWTSSGARTRIVVLVFQPSGTAALVATECPGNICRVSHDLHLSFVHRRPGRRNRASAFSFFANLEPYGIVPTAPQRWPGRKRSGPGQPCGLLATINMTFGIRKGWEGHRGVSPYGLNGEESAMRAKRLLCRQRKTKGDPANGRSSCAGCFARRW